MGILSQQLGISARATTNDIDVNPEARSLTAPSGFYADGGKYPDNRSVWDHNSLVEGADNPEQVGREAGWRWATGEEYNYAINEFYAAGGTDHNFDRSAALADGSGVVTEWRSGYVDDIRSQSGITGWWAIVEWEEETYFTDGIRPSSTAGKLG